MAGSWWHRVADGHNATKKESSYTEKKAKNTGAERLFFVFLLHFTKQNMLQVSVTSP